MYRILYLVVSNMYFALKSIGKDNEEKINNLASVSDKWQLIDRIAKNDGYDGIQFSNYW